MLKLTSKRLKLEAAAKMWNKDALRMNGHYSPLQISRRFSAFKKKISVLFVFVEKRL